MEPCGVLIIHKPVGLTSHDVVGRVRRLFGTRRVGHTGTLDPLASGVLVVLIGRAAKAAEYLVCDQKSYVATLRLGLTTDTEDVTGQVLSTSDTLPSEASVMAVIPRFTGELMQIPPMYSALKVGGQKLYDLARRGETVERAPRPITVHSLVCHRLSDSDYSLSVTCSAGTYIRTLCADIGATLGCGGVMATLERREAGGFSLSDSHTLEALEAMSPEERMGCLLPTESLFSDLPALTLPAFYERLARNGCEIYQKKLRTDFPTGTRLRLRDQNGVFYALGQVSDFPDGSAIKLIKLFELS